MIAHVEWTSSFLSDSRPTIVICAVPFALRCRSVPFDWLPMMPLIVLDIVGDSDGGNKNGTTRRAKNGLYKGRDPCGY